MTDIAADRDRLRELESELDEIRHRIASYQPAEFDRDGLILEATIRIAGAASESAAAARALSWAIQREIGGRDDG